MMRSDNTRSKLIALRITAISSRVTEVRRLDTTPAHITVPNRIAQIARKLEPLFNVGFVLLSLNTTVLVFLLEVNIKRCEEEGLASLPAVWTREYKNHRYLYIRGRASMFLYKKTVVVMLVVLTSLAVLTGGTFVYSTSASTRMAATYTVSSGVISMRMNVTLWSALYEDVSSPMYCEVVLLFPEGPMNLTVSRVAVDLMATDEFGTLGSILASVSVTYSPPLRFVSVQEVPLSEDMLIEPAGSSLRSCLACYVDMQAENSTGSYALSGGPIGVPAVPVIGWVLQPTLWIGLTGTTYALMALLMIRERKRESGKQSVT